MVPLSEIYNYGKLLRSLLMLPPCTCLIFFFFNNNLGPETLAITYKVRVDFINRDELGLGQASQIDTGYAQGKSKVLLLSGDYLHLKHKTC